MPPRFVQSMHPVFPITAFLQESPSDKMDILILKQGEQILFAVLQERQLEYLRRGSHAGTGEIYLGRVENVVQNLNACFVKFHDQETGYLPFDEIPNGALVNRTFQTGDRIRSGDQLPVQILVPPRKTKQAKLTGYLTLASHSAVIAPATLRDAGLHVSKRLPDAIRSFLFHEIKSRLEEGEYKKILSAYSVILRTEAGEGLETDSLPPDSSTLNGTIQDILALYFDLENIRNKLAPTRQVGNLLYRENFSAQMENHLTDLVHFIRNVEANPTIRVICNQKEFIEEIQQLPLLQRHPEMTVSYHDTVHQGISLENLYGLPSKLDDLSRKRIWLKSGAYLVIEATEALHVIDVNSGKDIASKKQLFFKTNMEAARESFRQIRLRNLSGMILIDFINLQDQREQYQLERELQRLCQLDPIRTRFVDFTKLGIAEITREAK